MVGFEIGDVAIYESNTSGSVQMKIVNVGGDGRLDLECEKAGKRTRPTPSDAAWLKLKSQHPSDAK